jgi:hypothetical protein
MCKTIQVAGISSIMFIMPVSMMEVEGSSSIDEKTDRQKDRQVHIRRHIVGILCMTLLEHYYCPSDPTG